MVWLVGILAFAGLCVWFLAIWWAFEAAKHSAQGKRYYEQATRDMDEVITRWEVINHISTETLRGHNTWVN